MLQWRVKCEADQQNVGFSNVQALSRWLKLYYGWLDDEATGGAASSGFTELAQPYREMMMTFIETEHYDDTQKSELGNTGSSNLLDTVTASSERSVRGQDASTNNRKYVDIAMPHQCPQLDSSEGRTVSAVSDERLCFCARNLAGIWKGGAKEGVEPQAFCGAKAMDPEGTERSASTCVGPCFSNRRYATIAPDGGTATFAAVFDDQTTKRWYIKSIAAEDKGAWKEAQEPARSRAYPVCCVNNIDCTLDGDASTEDCSSAGFDFADRLEDFGGDYALSCAPAIAIEPATMDQEVVAGKKGPKQTWVDSQKALSDQGVVCTPNAQTKEIRVSKQLAATYSVWFPDYDVTMELQSARILDSDTSATAGSAGTLRAMRSGDKLYKVIPDLKGNSAGENEQWETAPSWEGKTTRQYLSETELKTASPATLSLWNRARKEIIVEEDLAKSGGGAGAWAREGRGRRGEDPPASCDPWADD